MTPLAWIFDMDGVLVQTAHLHREAYLRVFDAEGLSDAAARLDALPRGLPREGVLTGVMGPLDPARLARLMAAKQREVEALVRDRGVQLEPESIACARRVRAAGLGLAVATSSRAAATFLGHHGLLGLFDAIVQRGDVARAKPAPDLFLRAADLLRTPPERCVVVEDSPGGVVAGLAAGCRVIGLTTTHSAEQLAEAHRVVVSLAGLGPDLPPATPASGRSDA